jgi:cell division protein ZapD
VITYEFPLNERVRTLLRLEDLFARFDHFITGDGSAEHHFALTILFEILEVASRADLKSELLQELGRQKQQLTALYDNPDISETALDGLLAEIDSASADLLGMSGKVGQYLRENEWLMSIKQRVTIPGGVCEFDLPSYHHWQHQSTKVRRQLLVDWLAPMTPLREALAILLKLLREGGKSYQFTANRGSFQQIPGGRAAQMLRLSVAQMLPCIPEVSANKYALNIRFVQANYSAKTSLYDQDVAFKLTFCNL